MKYYIGIDGGGTKTKYTLADENLNILSSFVGPACHYLQCGYNGLTEHIKEGITQVLTDTSEQREEIIRNLDGIFIGCAGYGDVEAHTPALNEAMADAIHAVLGNGFYTFRFGNDGENALAGALGGEPGINIIAGTGTMGCGKNPSGVMMRCGGWHYALGSDEGSGYWISWRMLKEFIRQSDGRDERTELYQAIRSALELKTDDELISRVVYEWDLDRTRIASLAPLCVDLYHAGDPHAAEILNDAAHELFDVAMALYKRLGYASVGGSEAVLVSGTGGVFKIGAPIIEPFSALLSENSMKYTPPLYEPDIGSVILARSLS